MTVPDLQSRVGESEPGQFVGGVLQDLGAVVDRPVSRRGDGPAGRRRRHGRHGSPSCAARPGRRPSPGRGGRRVDPSIPTTIVGRTCADMTVTSLLPRFRQFQATPAAPMPGGPEGIAAAGPRAAAGSGAGPAGDLRPWEPGRQSAGMESERRDQEGDMNKSSTTWLNRPVRLVPVGQHVADPSVTSAGTSRRARAERQGPRQDSPSRPPPTVSSSDRPGCGRTLRCSFAGGVPAGT